MLERLECSACAAVHDSAAAQTVCTRCGRSLSGRYDIAALACALRDGSIRDRPRSMWRYAEALPLAPGTAPVTLGEGFTPLVPLPRLAARLGLGALIVKDEGANPTGSFKSRGMAAAVTAARDRGATLLAVPSAGNAAGALAAYAARAGLPCRVYLPADAPVVNRCETRLFGAHVTVVEGTIAAAARALAADREAAADGAGWSDVSTLKEPFRLDGKKTMGYELFEQFPGGLPDVVLYPTGGGTGLLGMMKAFDELADAGLLRSGPPRMIAVQAKGAASLVEAYRSGRETAEVVGDARTLASGLRVPKAFADAWLLRDIRRSGGTAVAVSDDAILEALRATARDEGFLLCPEAAALVAALPILRDAGDVRAGERVVMFNTASPAKYPEVLELALR